MNFNLKLLVICLALGQNSSLFCPPKQEAPVENPLVRAQRTAQALVNLRARPASTDPRIHEIHVNAYAALAQASAAHVQATDAHIGALCADSLSQAVEAVIGRSNALASIYLGAFRAKEACDQMTELTLSPGLTSLPEFSAKLLILKELRTIVQEVELTMDGLFDDHASIGELVKRFPNEARAFIEALDNENHKRVGEKMMQFNLRK